MNVGAYNFSIRQGSTWNQKLTIKDSDSVAWDLTGYTARMQIKKSLSDEATEELTTENGKISIPNPTDGIIYLILSDIETSALTGNYIYDLELINGSGEVICPLAGKILLVLEITT